MRTLARYFAILLALQALLALPASAGSLDREQKDRLKDLAADTRRRMDSIRDQLIRARMELMEVYSSYRLDERRARSIQERVSKAQLDLLNTNLDNQIGLRRILNEEQFEEFSRMFARRMGGNPMGMFHGPVDAGPEWFREAQMLRDIPLPEQDKRRLRAAIDPGPEAMRSIQRLRDNTRKLLGLYGRYNLDEPAARRLIREIHGSQEYLAERHLQMQKAIRSALTEAEFEKYRDSLRNRLQERRDRRPFGRR